ncbi:hypothetical protein HZR84_00440 [Hyphobacterium sp. CCMP332]|nr:hypothetical protein HZR84_00440 [Hyphobacterium sp. CCMP332]
MKYCRSNHFTLILFLLLISIISSCDKKSSQNEEVRKLGTIEFENSGAENAQNAFYQGVLALHNFWYPVAEASFREAIQMDSGFAMAYWGEAMSKNKTLWQIQDRKKAREILSQLGNSKEMRLKMAELEVEKDFIRSLDVLYSEKDNKLERDQDYAVFMENMLNKYPDNLEVRAFYALSLLGLLRDNQGNEDIRMKCAAISQQVLDKNPNHPGALHYKIHALDDPLHAILALDAAYKYAKVAPESNHALHMPSHIFVQLGMWENVISSNINARNASENWVKKEKLNRTYLDNHSLSWLAYAYTQAGLFDSALVQLEKIQINNKDTFTRREKHYEIDILTRIWVENSSDLGDYSFEIEGVNSVSEMSLAKYQFAYGWRSLEKGERDNCLASIQNISEYLNQMDSTESFDQKIIEIYLNSLKGLYFFENSGFDNAESYFEKAILLEESLNPPTGPPDIIKPIHELYAEICLKEGKIEKSIDLFKTSLMRTPNRSMSRLGLARAYRVNGDFASAKYQYEKFAENYSNASDDKNQSEALTFIKNNEQLSSKDFISSSNRILKYDSKMKITQCQPLN